LSNSGVRFQRPVAVAGLKCKAHSDLATPHPWRQMLWTKAKFGFGRSEILRGGAKKSGSLMKEAVIG